MDKELKILNVARELFGEFGYKGTTVDLIAKKCDIGKGTFYLYYDSKEEILSSILKKEIEKVGEIVREATDKKTNFNEQLSYMLVEISKLKNEQVFLAKLVLEAKEENSETVCKHMKNLDDYIINQIAIRIESEIGKNKIDECNSEFYAFLLYKVYILLITEWEELFSKKLPEKEIYNLLEKLFKKN